MAMSKDTSAGYPERRWQTSYEQATVLSNPKNDEGDNMKRGRRRTILCAMGTAVVYLLGVASAGGQAGQDQKPLMAEDAFKNVQLLRGITVSQFPLVCRMFKQDV